MAKIQARVVTRNRNETERASTIYDYTSSSVESLWGAFELAKSQRGNVRGNTTDQEQDLLRAMLVMAASGLDSTLKQLIRDCMPTLIASLEDVHQQFEKFTLRELRGTKDDGTGETSPKFLARLLASPNPQSALIEAYVYELTGSSLQSAEQVLSVAEAFCLKQKAAVGDVPALKEVFHVRNKIIHELDIDLDAPRRKRNVRKQKKMKEDTELLLDICANFISNVDMQLRA